MSINNLKSAKNLFLNEDYTFLVFKNNKVLYSSYERGLKPLLYIFKNNREALEDACVSDKIIGKAAAMILLESNINSLYANVISINALDILEKSNVNLEYGKVVKEIKNRDNTDICPMEKLSLESKSANELILKIEDFFKNEN